VLVSYKLSLSKILQEGHPCHVICHLGHPHHGNNGISGQVKGHSHYRISDEAWSHENAKRWVW